MQRLMKRNEMIFYSIFVVVLMIIAFVSNNYTTNLMAFFIEFFQTVAKVIRKFYSVSSLLAYFVYILICLSPLVYPLVRTIKTKELNKNDIAWLILSILLFITIFYFINPNLLKNSFTKDFISNNNYGFLEQYQEIQLISYGITVFAMFAFCLICEFKSGIENETNRAFFYAKILFSIMIVGVLLNFAYFESIKTRSVIEMFNRLPVDNKYSALNSFIAIAMQMIKVVPTYFTFLLFLQARNIVISLQYEMFSVENIPRLREISKTCLRTIITTLGVMIMENVIYMLLSDKLYIVNKAITIPLALIIATCLIVILSKIMIKAIEINEENKLVI